MRAIAVAQEGDIGTFSAEDWLWPDPPLPRRRHQRDKNFRMTSSEGSVLFDVPSDFFLRNDGWKMDQVRLDWPRGIFVARRPAKIVPLAFRSRAVVTAAGARIHEVSESARPLIRRGVVGLMVNRQEVQSILEEDDRPNLQVQNSGTASDEHHAIAFAVPSGLNWKAAMNEIEERIANGTMVERFGHFQQKGIRGQIFDFLRATVFRFDGTPISVKHARRTTTEIIDRWRSADAKRHRIAP